jgi:hypothetical protein
MFRYSVPTYTGIFLALDIRIRAGFIWFSRLCVSVADFYKPSNKTSIYIKDWKFTDQLKQY